MEFMGSGAMNCENSSRKKGETSSSSTKCCADCKTTKTPLWRAGPSGPKSLCNACGIRYRKKRFSVGSPPPASSSPDRKRERPPAQPHGPHREGSDMGKDLGESVRMSLFLVGNDLLIRGAKKQMCRRKRKLGEEELAAVSLMALSCGCVFA